VTDLPQTEEQLVSEAIETQVIIIEVVGTPQTRGSKRPFRRGKKIVMVDDNKRSGGWMGQVADAARQVYTGPLLRGPVTFEMTFRRARPKGHYGTGRNAGVLKDSAPRYPIGSPDVTKCVRAAEDALTKVVWYDDAQVVSQENHKVYGEPEGVTIVIVPL